jgi:diguanylate cyclase (GGDEF)-like protein
MSEAVRGPGASTGGREIDREGVGGPPSTPPGARAARVLVVEDSRTQAQWLARVLEGEGYQVQVAVDGREAIRRVSAEPPDLVFLDMILPDMHGLEVLRAIKSSCGDQFIPVILLSVKSDLDSRVAGLRMGADDFLAKPYADAEIQARTAAMLRIKALQDQLRGTKAKLERLSVTDGLTGLYNHLHFEDRLRDEICRSQRYNNAPASLIMLDLDHFKRVNDEYGHPFGDRVLRGTAELISTAIRGPDICARYGGEEFAVILPNTLLQGALAVAERFLRKLREKSYPVVGPGNDPGGEVRVTASAGVAVYPTTDVNTPETLLKCADDALYRAKREGRDRACAHQPGARGGAGDDV